MNRLMLGSGIFKRDGWKTLDCNPVHHPDFLATIPPLPDAVKAVDWDEIEWIHGITSLVPWEGEQVLLEIYSVLPEEGKLVLEQPNFTKAHATKEWVFGDPLLRNKEHMNRWAYEPMDLIELLDRIGYRRITLLPAQHHVPERDFRVEAWR